MGVRALGAFSGGLDGMLAALLLESQGVEVELATFSSPFFESKPGCDGASELGFSWREIPFTEEILTLL